MKWPADPGLLIETKVLSLPKQPHPGSAPGRPHSWNSCTLPEPAPLLLRGPQHCQPGTGSWGEPLLCQEGAEHNAGLKGSRPLPKMLGSADGP